MNKIVNLFKNNWCEIVAYSSLILFFLILDVDYRRFKEQTIYSKYENFIFGS
jgi:hypothetical protein